MLPELGHYAIESVVIFMAVSLFAIATATTWWQLYAWRSPEEFEGTYFAQDELAPRKSFSLIVPAYEEPEHVMRATIEHLVAQTHPDFEIILSCASSDAPTIAIAEKLAADYPRHVRGVSIYQIPEGQTKSNKPKQLNAALTMCTKELLGIFDAESLAAPDLLVNIDRMFQVSHADIVQGAVQLMNYRDGWMPLRNCLEYRTWFRSRLHGHARTGFIPLGGNTCFFYTSLIHELGGWDGNCLAEDCDIGVRASIAGKRVAVAYHPSLVTREETPQKISELIKQRTRWSLGFMQVLAKKDWKSLPTRKERMLAWWTLVQQHAMAFAGFCLPVAIVTVLLADLPLWLSMLSFLPAFPAIVMVATETMILREFGQDFDLKIRWRDYTKLVISTPIYQLILAAAAVRAWVKFKQGDFAWEKTSHSGAHLEMEMASS